MSVVIDGIVMDGRTGAYVPDDILSIAPTLLLHLDEKTDIDPITFEVIRYALWNVNEEHGSTIARVSGSPIAVFGHDFNPCLLTEDAEYVYFGPYLQFHAGVQDLNVKWVLENRSASPGIHDGDMFILNDPWIGACHQSDVGFLCPVFVDGGLFCWVANTLHFADLGGPTPGGWVPEARTVFDEPVPTPPLKIMENGELRSDVAESWVRRSRLPELTALDLRACIAGNTVARTGILALVERYGASTVKGVMKKIIRDAATVFATRLSAIPDGTWRERSYLEVAYPGDRNTYELNFTITKREDRLTISNAGTDPQVGALNCAFAGWRAGVLSVLNPMLGHDLFYAVGGPLRHIDFVPTPGTLTCANYPASVSNGVVITTCITVGQTMNALSKMLIADPDARSEICANPSITQWPVVSLSGIDQRGRYFGNVILDFYAGGLGAFSFRDGIHTGGMYHGPRETAPNVEHNEDTMPLLYLYRRERQDGGGGGEFAGGTSLDLAFVPHQTDSIVHQLAACGVAFPTSVGLFGGLPGYAHGYELIRGSDVHEQLARGDIPTDVTDLTGERHQLLSKEANLIQETDDVFRVWANGGGGFGDPLDRDPEAVAEDIRAGYVSSQYARDAYGVVIASDGTVDDSATSRFRQDQRNRRLADAGGPARRASQPVGDVTREWLAGASVVARDHAGGARSLSCSRCGYHFGPANGNYKEYLLRSDAPLADSLAIAEDKSALIDDVLVFRSFYCPSCACAITREVTRSEDLPLLDIRYSE